MKKPNFFLKKLQLLGQERFFGRCCEAAGKQGTNDERVAHDQNELGDQVVDHVAVYVGQAEVAALITVSELLVIEAHQLEDRGV